MLEIRIDWKIQTGHSTLFGLGRREENLCFSHQLRQVVQTLLITVVLDYNGNVGIKTGNPVLALDVSGDKIGRCTPGGNVHTTSHRNSFKIGRFDGNSRKFLWFRIKS